MKGKRRSNCGPRLPRDMWFIAAASIALGTLFLVLLALAILWVIGSVGLDLLSADPSGQSKAAETIMGYVSALLAMVLLIGSGVRIYLRRLVSACLGFGLSVPLAIYGLVQLRFLLPTPLDVIAWVVAIYPALALLYLVMKMKLQRGHAAATGRGR